MSRDPDAYPPEYDHVTSLDDVEGAVVVGNKSRSSRAVAHLEDPTEPGTPVCKTTLRSAEWRRLAVADAGSGLRLCHACNPSRDTQTPDDKSNRTPRDVLAETGHLEEVDANGDGRARRERP